MPFSRLNLATSFKDKADILKDVNSGLFVYPVLMCADILMYDAEVIPVGKDQQQHIEFAREIARKVNHHYDSEIFVLPEIKLDEKVMLIPGIDCQKMSKSYNNYIDIFESKKQLKKSVMKIVTDDKTLEEPKDPDSCIVFELFSSVATKEQSEEMAQKYRAGNFGYGHAKIELFELLWSKYEVEREKYNYYMNNLEEIENLLIQGENKAREVAVKV